jgi:hypothetical protein
MRGRADVIRWKGKQREERERDIRKNMRPYSGSVPLFPH